MRNLLLIALLFLAFCTNTEAQVKTVTYSAPFDEPTAWLKRVIQLPNGNTFFLTIDNETVATVLYNKERKIIGKMKIDNDVINKKTIKYMSLKGLHEIDGEPVIFVQFIVKRVPYLYRIRFSKDNGRIVEQKKLGELKKYKITDGYAMAFGGVSTAEFRIIKDPNSDAYAQVNFNSFANETNKRIEIVQYRVIDGKHEIVNSAFYDVSGFKYVNEIGTCINEDDVFITAYAYNTMASGGKDSRIIISKLSKGTTSFTHKQIEYSEDFKDTHGTILYNKKHDLIQLMTTTIVKTKNQVIGSKSTSYYMVLMNYIDPVTLQIVKSIPLPTEGLNNAALKQVNTKKGGFNGLPKNMVLLNDYSTAILLEEETTVSSSRYSYTMLGKAGILNLSYKGEEQGAYSIIKEHGNTGYFFSYDFAHANGKQYVIYNDHWENMDMKEPKKYHSTKYVGESVAIYYQLQNGNMERKYLLGASDKDKDTKFVDISSGQFNNNNNTYAALVVHKAGRKKTAKIAWIEFE